jgi:hypothetical protein
MSEKDCRNDCTTPLQFPRRPGTSFSAGHGEDCLCCDSDERISADNRPALPHFNYRIGTYATIREFLFHQINHTQNLQNWTYRDPDDPAVALLEGAAVLGDILTFYQETYANEAFLRTAKWRESISDLVRLLGYRLSPALGGNATFAFEIKKDEAITIPAGFPVKATLEELEKPADFEIKEEITAYPWLSRFNLFRPLEQPDVTVSTTEFYIDFPNQMLSPLEIKAGDRLMIGVSGASGTSQPKELTKAEIVIVDSIRELHGKKIFKIKGNLTQSINTGKLAAYKLGRVFHHFGYNSPLEFVKPEEEFTSTSTVDGGTTTTTASITIEKVPNWRAVNKTYISDLVDPDLSKTEFPIDAEVQDLPGNIPVIIQGNFSKPSYSGAQIVADETINQKEAPNQMEAINVIEEISQMGQINDYSQINDYTGQVMSGLYSYDYDYYNPLAGIIMSDEPNIVLGKSAPVSTAFTLVRTISSIKSASVAWGALSATVSLLSLSESMDTSVGDNTNLNIRDALFHETVSPLFFIKNVEVETSAEKGKNLNFYGTAAQVENLRNRRILLEKTGAEAKILTVTDVPENFDEDTLNFPQLYPVTISDEVDYVDFPNENPLVTIYGNLADADQGKTLPETVLGSGDNTKAFQTFKLPKAPLTYHIETANTPPETPELEIYVGGRLWQQVEGFFGREAGETIYIVREDAENNSWVQFGDGKTGAKLPTGIKNVTAVHRIGTGAFGALEPDTKAQAGAKLRNLDKIQMPIVAYGGSEREDGENAKNAAPGKVQSLGRLVSVRDFESEAAAIAGVVSASAAWKLDENIPSISLVILMETGRSGETASVGETLSGYNVSRGAARFPVEIYTGKRLYVTASIKYALDSTYRADLVEPEIRRALGVNFAKATNKEDQTGLFSIRQRRFGEREYASSIEGAVQSVAGVIWAQVTAFSALTDSDEPDSITLSDSHVLHQVILCDDEHILSLYDKHLFLTQIVEEGN